MRREKFLLFYIKRYNMKKVIILFAVLALAVLIALVIVTCKGKAVQQADVLSPPVLREPGPPELAVSLSPHYFSPDGDGTGDELFITIDCKDDSPIAEWKFEVMEAEQPNKIFFEWSGKDNPPGRIVWNGRGYGGELVQSAADYPFILTVKNMHGLISVQRGYIVVDLLVVNEGNQLRMQVPSIVFSSGTGGFTGLNEETLGRNDFILRRIALALNKFDTYKVTVEGHANHTAATEAARRLEQERELRPLSEQRAKFVVDYLVKLGVDRSRLTSVGVGGARPVANYEDRDNWWKNRRVDFILTK
jgi:hypothetical protein